MNRNWTGRCKCSNCNYQWMGVVHLREKDVAFPLQLLQCPECKQMTGLADPVDEEDDQDTYYKN